MDDKEPQQRPTLRLFSGPEITLATLPIHEAAREGNAAGVREALEAGNPVDSHDAEGYTPLMIAAQNGFLPLFEFLLSAGADPYDGFEELQTALTLAVYSEQIDIVRAWVARRLEVNGGGKMFLGPLGAAASTGNVEIARLLLQGGADINAKDGAHQTPLSLAIQARRREMTAFLRQAGGIMDPADTFLEHVGDEPPPDFQAAAAEPAFQGLLQRLTDLFECAPVVEKEPAGVYRFEGVKISEFATRYAREDDVARVIFERWPGQEDRVILHQLQVEVRREGFHLILAGPCHGAVADLLLLPTADKFVVLAALETDGANYGLGPKSLRTWLRKMEKRHPFMLTGAALDYVEGRFKDPVRNARRLAEKMYRICPDIVEQGCGSVEALGREMERTQQFVLWWD